MRSAIELIFEGKAFLLPLFYSYQDSLRFELSEGGTSIEQFLLAMNKASAICADIFAEDSTVTLCLRAVAEPNHHAHRRVLRELKHAGIAFPNIRELWLERRHPDDWFDENIEEWWVNIAFEIPKSKLQNALWCAFATDFSSIQPNPHCVVYLFNLDRKIMVLPYDDRGMDVAGPNFELLHMLYKKHNHFLLDYDRDAMDRTFSAD